MSTSTQPSDNDKEPVFFNPHLTVDLGINHFKKLLKERMSLRPFPKSVMNKMIKEFKVRQWGMYHQLFPMDNSSVPNHSHFGEQNELKVLGSSRA